MSRVSLVMTGYTHAAQPSKAALIVVALLAGLVLAGCVTQPPAPAPTWLPQATYTPYPTYTPLPTQPPQPTYTPASTATAAKPTVPPTNTPAPTPTATPVVYVVKPGDSATLIARRFGVALQALLVANNISNPDVVERGRQLLIPVGATVTGTLSITRTVLRQWPAPTPASPPSEAASADPNRCASRALLIFHTFWNDRPEPGVKFDIHSQPDNPNHDPAKFRFATNAQGTAYFCMPEHTRYYFYTDREATFDARLEVGQMVEKVINVPRLDLVLVAPLGAVTKPETPIKFSWQPYPGAASYVLTVYGQQDNFWGGDPTVVAFQAQVKPPQTQATASFSFDPQKGIYPGRAIRWLVTAYNAKGTVIGKAKLGDFSMLP